ncbi:MAG TPA: helix-turn-helix transcriptional regulator [Thermoanaerobaculia bacterium]|nr:helix-turn-helix transcriptional regulator [Thermoanaerobaculia bacterium]
MPTFDGLGKALRWLRDRQSRRQYQVAESAGVTKAMLSAYETGKQRPSVETLERILGALKVDLADLQDALDTVNRRPPRLRGSLSGDTTRPGEPGADVYLALGLERSLAPAEEMAFTEMLRGFHRLLRYYHEHSAGLARGRVTYPEPESSPEN